MRCGVARKKKIKLTWNFKFHVNLTRANIAYLARLELFYENLVDTQRAGASGQAQNEGVLGSRVEGLDAVDNVVGDIAACSSSVVAND